MKSPLWRLEAMGRTLLDIYLKPDSPIPASLATLLTEGLLAEHPTTRAVALKITIRVLRYLKARARKASNDRTRVLTRTAKMGDKTQDFTAKYLAESTVNDEWGSA
jgi:adenylate cyclase